MSRPIRIIMILLACLVLAYPIEAALSGLIVERQVHRAIQRALLQTPYVTLTDWRYQRGIYTTHEQATFTVRAAGLRPNGPSWELSVRQTIHHGPLAQGRTFALATIETELMLPASAPAEIRRSLGTQPPLQIYSILGWLGGSRSQVTSPALQARLDGAVTLASQGMTGTATTDRSGSITHADLRAPGLSVADDRYRFGWNNLSVSSSGQRVFGSLNAGKASGSISDLQMLTPAGGDVEIHGLSFASDTSVSGDFMDMQIGFKAASLRAAKFAATDLDYDVALKHLHGPSLAVMINKIRAINANTSTQPAVRLRQMSDELRADGAELLARAPALEITRFGFKTPDGSFSVSATVTAPGLQRSDVVTAGPRLTVALLQKAEVIADISIDQGLIGKWTATGTNAGNIAAQIGLMQAQGYIKHDGNTLGSHVDWTHGRLRLNGKPFPPPAAAH